MVRKRTAEPYCKDCGIKLTKENAYQKRGSSTGFQTRCKKHQIEYQLRVREKKSATKGHTILETKYSGYSNELKLVYNPRRQIVDIFGSINAKDAAVFWVQAFDKTKYVYNEHKRTFKLRIPHVSSELWDEVTIDLETEESLKDNGQLKDFIEED